MKEKEELIDFVLGKVTDAEKIQKRKEFVENNVSLPLEDFHAILLSRENSLI